MQIKRGTWRIVLLIPALGIAIKFPRIYWRKSWGTIKLITIKRSKSWKALLGKTLYSELSLKQWMLRGIGENWREFLFYRKTKHLFCEPTYFSLFGLINLQKFGTACLMNDYDFFIHLIILTNGKVWRSPHHFSNSGNFAFTKGKLTILDYGNLKVQEVVSEYGQKIWEEFDPSFVSDKSQQDSARNSRQK